MEYQYWSPNKIIVKTIAELLILARHISGLIVDNKIQLWHSLGKRSKGKLQMKNNFLNTWTMSNQEDFENIFIIFAAAENEWSQVKRAKDYYN